MAVATRERESRRDAVEVVPLDPVIVYTRKSSEDANMQVRSHEQQLESIHAEYPPDGIFRTFSDDKSGKTFSDRVGFQAMLTWCQRHAQPRNRPGRIVMYDKSRFGRALIPGTDETDWIAYDEARLAFAKVGWELVFIRSKKTGNKMVDRIVDTLDDEQSSEYIRRLSANVTRGQEDAILAGYWVRGSAPFPACRVEARTGRVLADALRDEDGAVVREGKRAVQPAERVQAGARVLLAPDDAKVPHWVHGAEMLLAGESWRAVLTYFNTHVPTARKGRRGRWTRKGLKQVYENEALVGVLVRVVKGKRTRVPAAWAPVVDPALFYRVQDEIAAREARYATSGRMMDQGYVLRNVLCAHCGGYYRGNFSKARTETRHGKTYERPARRYYQHVNPLEARLSPEQQQRCDEHGCRNYRIPAEFLEAQVRDLILAQRGTEQLGAALAARFEDAQRQRGTATHLVEQTETRVRELNEELVNLTSALGKTSGAAQDRVLAQMATAEETLAQAERDLAAHTARLAAAKTETADIHARIDETALICKAWDSESLTHRQNVVNWWVRGIAVEVVPRASAWRHGTVYDKICHVELYEYPATLPIVVPGVLREACVSDGEGENDSKKSPTWHNSTHPGWDALSSAHLRKSGVGMAAGSYLAPATRVCTVLIPGVLRSLPAAA